MSKYDRKYYLRQTQRGFLRKQYLLEIKGGKCEKCGYDKCSRCLQFHHRDPKKKSFNMDLRRIGNKNWKVVLEEFAKCDVLCANCHGELHDAETSKEYLDYEMIRQENEERVCLNCGKKFATRHSLCKKGGGKFCSIDCYAIVRRIVVRPDKETLARLVWEKPTCQIAADFGLSDKAVEKWCKKYELSKPPRGYWQKRNVNKKIE
jgi:hypothetical protein